MCQYFRPSLDESRCELNLPYFNDVNAYLGEDIGYQIVGIEEDLNDSDGPKLSAEEGLGYQLQLKKLEALRDSSTIPNCDSFIESK